MTNNNLIGNGETLFKHIGTYISATKYSKGFRSWQIHGQFTIGFTSLLLSDHLSGCGPIIMYKYDDGQTFDSKRNIDMLCTLIGYTIISLSLKEYNRRIPTSLQFVQGIRGRQVSYFFNKLKEMGFIINEYPNIAHGLTTLDKQCFCFYDFTTKIERIKELRTLVLKLAEQKKYKKIFKSI